MNNSTKKLLGLDLGANSIGWSLIEIPVFSEEMHSSEARNFEEGKIIRSGVRIFPAGKENFESAKEKSLTEDRRKSRGMRRRTRRIYERKTKLKKILEQHGLWPGGLEQNTNDPLELRARGIDEKLTLGELGQALYHLCQRRGFRSARKTTVIVKPTTAKSKKDAPQKENQETASAEKEEKKEDILAEIGVLAEKIKQSGKRTLGAYLYSLRGSERIRGRHTRRDMYLDEFNMLWDKQAEYYPDILTDELKTDIGGDGDKKQGIIFYQRNIYWRQSTIGQCELEDGEQRCPRADRLAQEFRFYQEINNLKYVDPTTNDEIRVADDPEALKRIVELGSKKEKVKFNDIRKAAGLEGTSIRFNFESGKRKKGKNAETEEDTFRSDLKGFETDAVLRKDNYFGKNWDKIPEEERNKIVRILIEKPSNPEAEKMVFDKKTGIAKQMTEEEFRKYMEDHWKDQWGLTDEQIDRLLDVENELPKGYLSLSRKALQKLLPLMRQGVLFSGPADKNGEYNDALHNAGYQRRDEENEWEVFDFLPSVEQIKNLGTINNPVVRRIVNETRRLINAIIKEYGRPDKIHIELARSAKANSEDRKKIIAQNNQNRKEREDAKKRIEEFEEYKVYPSRDAILRLRLWEQQKQHCPYSGQPISITQLFDKSGVIDIDHILPYSRTLDDSQMNKVVCFRSANADKGDQSPYEWYKSKYPKDTKFDDEFKELQTRISKYPWQKKNRFLQKEIDADGFTQRQLNDTKYAARYMLQYLRSIFTPEEWKAERRILTVKGGQTSDLRHYWGLNDILHNSDFLSDDLEPGEKNRSDHRHHAVDALVIALTDTMQLKRLATYKYRSQRQAFPKPWLTFRSDAEKSINDIVVSHRPIGRVRGKLHKDFYYGPVYAKTGTRREGIFVRRKKLDSLSRSEVFAIRDETIKELVFTRLKEHGYVRNKKGKSLINEESGKNAKADEIKEALGDDMLQALPKEFVRKLSNPDFSILTDELQKLILLTLKESGISYSEELIHIKTGKQASDKEIQLALAEPLYLPANSRKQHDNAQLTEIKKVRISVNDNSMVPINSSETAFVATGSNHHICLFEIIDEKGQPKRYAVFATRMEANQRLCEQQRRLSAKREELQAQGMTGVALEKSLRDYRKIVVTQEVPVVRRFDPDRPTAKFLFTLKHGEMFKVVDKRQERLVIFNTAPSTSGQFVFLDHRDAQKDFKKITKQGSSYFDILEKVVVDRLGNTFPSND